MSWSTVMDATYWHKQTPDQPIFPDLLWTRPENKLHAGKLLIIGGNLYGFSSPATAYQASVDAGVGIAKVLLPDALQKTVGQLLETAEFAPSTPSGSFAKQALAEFLDLSAWADGVLLGGDLGRNSETAIVLEEFLAKYSGQLTLTKDAVDYFYDHPSLVLERPNTTLVLSLSQLQKLARAAKSPKPVTFGMDLLKLVDFLHDFTMTYKASIVVKHLENIFVAVDGRVSTTKLSEDKEVWRVATASAGAVWTLQHPHQIFEALTVSLVNYFK